MVFTRGCRRVGPRPIDWIRPPVEATARQPEAASTIQTQMILTAALIEGVALFAVVVGLLAVLG